MMIVTGPSLTRATFMSAPNLPVSTRAPSARNSATTASTSGSATGPGAALFQVGRRPLAVSAYSVNWLTTRSGAFRSEQDFSPSRMRSPHSLAASFLAFSAVSSWVTPTRTRSPGPSIAPMTAPSTQTLASLTRCATARMAQPAATFDLVQPARQYCGGASSEIRADWANAARHNAFAVPPQSWMVEPPVELAKVSVTQPLPDGPYWSWLVPLQTPIPIPAATRRATTIRAMR